MAEELLEAWSQSWLALVVELAGEERWIDDGTEPLTVRLELTGGPDGELVSSWRLVDGRLVGAEAGTDAVAAAEAQLVLTLSHQDAAELLAGGDANVAYMQGRLKVAGSMALALALLVESRGARAADLRARIGERTTPS